MTLVRKELDVHLEFVALFHLIICGKDVQLLPFLAPLVAINIAATTHVDEFHIRGDGKLLT